VAERLARAKIKTYARLFRANDINRLERA
jgi:hypothetical protein